MVEIRPEKAAEACEALHGARRTGWNPTSVGRLVSRDNRMQQDRAPVQPDGALHIGAGKEINTMVGDTRAGPASRRRPRG